MNEATLEARVNAELKRIFPQLYGISLSHQLSFTLKFGHHEIEVNKSKQSITRGRLDILVQYDKRNLAILELKRPNKALNDQDRDQGISYARLMSQMPPIVIVSNGKETLFFRTYDKKEWQPSSIDEQAVQSLFSEGFSCAESELDQAVQFLLGRNQDIWKEIFQQENEKIFSYLRGDIDDFTRPLISDLNFKRTVVNQIKDYIESGENLISLVGPPLSGKTNVLFQLCNLNLNSFFPLYIDTSSCRHGVIQHIANLFSRKLFRATSTEEVKNWLLNGFSRNHFGKMVLILDEWSDQIAADLDELIELMHGDSFSIIVSMDESSFSLASQSPGRPTKTLFGLKAKTISLDLLDKNEFKSLREQIYQERRLAFEHGAEFNTEFRNPRILRIVLSDYWQNGDRLGTKEGTFIKLPGVTSFTLLKTIWSKFASDIHFLSDFEYLVTAYFDKENTSKSDPSFSILSHGRGHIKQLVAEKVLGAERIKRLLTQGHIQLVHGPNHEVLLLPKIPELLSAAGAHRISKETVKLIREGKVEEAYNELIAKSMGLPYQDLVSAYSIMILGEKEPNELSNFLFRLLDDKPVIESVKKNKQLLTYFPDLGEVRIDIKDDLEDCYTIENLLPWLTLSQIASLPIETEEGSSDFHLQILAEVGSFSRFLRRVDIHPLEDMQGFHFHDISGGTYLCGSAGIVEPITFAMVQGFKRMPEDIIRLCHWAVENDNKFLAWRLYTSALTNQDITEEKIQVLADEAQKILSGIVKPNNEMC